MLRSRLPSRLRTQQFFSSRHQLKSVARIIPFSTNGEQQSSSTRQKIVPITVTVALGLAAATYFFFPDPYRGAPTTKNAPLSPSHFTPVKVISNEHSGPDTKLLKIAVPSQLLPAPEDRTAFFTPIWSVFIKDDDIQVERPYTPLEGVNENGHMLFWIKKYPKGEVGRWLHSKVPGDEIELRGPLMTWPWMEDKYDEVVMISGGTGITPFYQLFHTLIANPSTTSKTRFTLLHSSRIPEELPPSAILDPLVQYSSSNPDKFRLHVFVDSQDGSTPPSPIPEIHTGRISETDIRRCIGLGKLRLSWWQKLYQKEEPVDLTQRRILFIVCGPEPMINAISGPYGRNYSQGPVGGMLAAIGFSSSQVRKL
ncbi:hypothetical protein BDQ12DRAFT_718449 [Crucibulum laeve]|uniref:FAD-binding FR-type domain-containing protein n=1 Tax=Crucibulum laeve TaxID=68775 RepID=A0A5C3MCY6_9AGAR|nr:hypothetical protein BDQ12DRAFT_718449 [Crucibulum laeve]